MRTLAKAIANCRREPNSQDGFGMIELMIAGGIILVAVLSIAISVLVGFSDIALARQRQSANGLADQTMEQVRGLPLDTLARGLSNTDLAATAGISDLNITKTGSGSTLKYFYAGEQIPRGDDPNVVPLVPHLRTIKVGPTTYSISVYVTYYGNDASQNTLRVTVLVSWTNVERQGISSKVQVQSIFAAPAGCLSTATHPFAAPCQPFLYGLSSRDQGHIDITGSIDGLALDHASVWLPGEGSAIQVEQISAIQGVAQSSGVALERTGQAETLFGRQAVSSGSDNDPAQPKPAYQTASTAAQTTQTQQNNGGGNSITVTSSGGDAATTTSTTTANLTGNYCPNVTGLSNLTSNLPCAGATSQTGGTNSVVVHLNPSGGTDIGSATLASAVAPSCGASACPNDALAYRFVATTGGLCPSTATDGCVHSEAARTIGQVTLGGLPANLSGPAGWAAGGGYLIRLTSLQDSVSAESGIGTAAPTLTAPATGTGSISFWNGAGYTTCTLYAANCPVTGGNYPIVPVAWTTTVDGNPLVVSMSATITAGGKPTTSSCSGTCTHTSATASSGAPLLGDITYQVSYNGSTVMNVNIHVDLGALIANTSYQAAPSG